jgi:hypothetical protein
MRKLFWIFILLPTLALAQATNPTHFHELAVGKGYDNTFAGDLKGLDIDEDGKIWSNEGAVFEGDVDITGTLTGTFSIDISDNTNLAVTSPIVLTDDTLSHAATAGNIHIPTAGATTQILQWSAAGTAKWITISGDASLADNGALTVTIDITDINPFTEAQLETQLSDVTDVFTNNDTIDISDYTNLAATSPIILTDDTLSHAATAGNIHIPTAGASTQILQYSAAGTAKWITLSGQATIADGGVVSLSNIDISDDTNLAVTSPIILTDDTLSHAATSGWIHVPAGGASTQILQYSAAGTAKWITISGDATLADGGVLTVSGGSGGATTEAELESDLTDVTDVFTNNDNTITIGESDSEPGQIQLMGDSTTQGAIARFYNAAGEDTTTDYWAIEADADFKLKNVTTDVFIVDDATGNIDFESNELSDIGKIILNDGSAAAPSLVFASSTTNGFYRAGGSEIGWSISGTLEGTFNAGGIAVADGTAGGSAGITAGTSDTEYGFFRVFGDNATQGGYHDIYNSASEDTTTDYWRLEADDTLKILGDTTLELELTPDGVTTSSLDYYGGAISADPLDADDGNLFTIAGGAITIDQIDNGETGQVIVIMNLSGKATQTIKDDQSGSANIDLPGSGVDATLVDAGDNITLIFDGTDWIQIAKEVGY